MNSSPALQMLSKVRVVVEKTRPLITLVFTDVVGSSATKRVDVLGPDTHSRDRKYISLIQVKYLRLVRSAVREHNGKEVMTIGDSFFLTFENPDDALECSMAIQRTLYTQPIYTPHGPLQLRIGIHVGSPEYFERSWHGTDVDIAARIEGIGSPGQIVLTDAARNAMSGEGLKALKFATTAPPNIAVRLDRLASRSGQASGCAHPPGSILINAPLVTWTLSRLLVQV